jgi:hypothetical protein
MNGALRRGDAGWARLCGPSVSRMFCRHCFLTFRFKQLDFSKILLDPADTDVQRLGGRMLAMLCAHYP